MQAQDHLQRPRPARLERGSKTARWRAAAQHQVLHRGREPNGGSIRNRTGSANTGWLSALNASTRKSAEHFSAIGNVRRTARSIFDMPKPVIAFRPRSPGPSIATNAAGFRRRPPGACRSAIQTGARQVHGGCAVEHGDGNAGARVEQPVQCQPRGRSTENAAASEWRTSKSDEPASVAENAADGAQKTSASAELLSMECSQL